MGRLHLVELHEQPWFPRAWRDTLTGFLRFVAEKSGHARIAARKVTETVRETGATRIVDLCAGGGGPTPSVVKALAADGIEVEARVTDLHPNLAAFEAMVRESEGKIAFEKESVDATKVPARLSGVRTIFNAFHHFRPALAKEILAAAQRDRQPIVVVELVGRNAPMLLGMLVTPLTVLLATPFLRPVHWSSIVFTYLVPVLPLVAAFDGIVSVLRVYSPKELDALTADLQAPDWTWETGTLPLGGPAHATWLVGRPRQ